MHFVCLPEVQHMPFVFCKTSSFGSHDLVNFVDCAVSRSQGNVTTAGESVRPSWS
jgi:hypothetical protein